MKKYKFSDEVSMRLIQIFQEAILLGIDGADLLRQVVVVEGEGGDGTLELEATYIETVERFHEELLAEINEKMAEAEAGMASPSTKILS